MLIVVLSLKVELFCISRLPLSTFTLFIVYVVFIVMLFIVFIVMLFKVLSSKLVLSQGCIELSNFCHEEISPCPFLSSGWNFGLWAEI